jgi:hypothetical protein
VILLTCITAIALNAQTQPSVDIPSGIARELIARLQAIDQDLASDEDFRVVPSDFLGEAIDLNGDFELEIYVKLRHRSWCGATGNCWVWLLAKIADNYRLVLEADGVQGIEPQPTSTNGYRDLFTRTHQSSQQSTLVLYQFDGTRYKATTCFDRNYLGGTDATGKYVVDSQPTIKRVNCRIEIPKAILEELLKEHEWLNADLSPDDMHRVRVESFVGQSIDLNRDGVPELYVTGEDLSLCSPTGNCPGWIFFRKAVTVTGVCLTLTWFRTLS